MPAKTPVLEIGRQCQILSNKNRLSIDKRFVVFYAVLVDLMVRVGGCDVEAGFIIKWG